MDWKGLAGFASGKVITTIIATSTVMGEDVNLISYSYATAILKGVCNEQIY